MVCRYVTTEMLSVLSETSTKRSISVAETIDLEVHLEINTKCTGLKWCLLVLSLKHTHSCSSFHLYLPWRTEQWHSHLQRKNCLSSASGSCGNPLLPRNLWFSSMKWGLFLWSLNKPLEKPVWRSCRRKIFSKQPITLLSGILLCTVRPKK